MGFSLEEEREARSRLVKAAEDEGRFSEEVAEAITAVGEAEDSVGISLAMRLVVAKRLLMLIGEGKVGAGDLVRLMGMIADRVDGKVKDEVQVSGVIGLRGVLEEIWDRGEAARLPDYEAEKRAVDAMDAEVLE